MASPDDIASLDISFNSGWGFRLLEIFFKQLISSNYHAWLMFVAIVTGTCIAVTFYKYSHNYFYSVFLFLATTNFTWLMNGIRQFLVVAIIFAATPLIKENKWFKFILIVLLASTIHGTALLMLPVFFFVRSKPWTSRTMLLFVGVLFVLFFTSSFTSILEDVFAETKYENIGDKFLTDDGVNPIRVLVFSITTILAFFARNRIPKDDILINIFVNMSLVTSGLYLIAMATSGILLGRLPMYTQLYQYMLLPYVIDNLFEKRTKNLVYIASIILFLLYFKIASKGFYYSSDLTGFIA
jgi:transmembrane protein EpsG